MKEGVIMTLLEVFMEMKQVPTQDRDARFYIRYIALATSLSLGIPAIAFGSALIYLVFMEEKEAWQVLRSGSLGQVWGKGSAF
jgi:hypothetical protein